jgi:hypothetical protein
LPALVLQKLSRLLLIVYRLMKVPEFIKIRPRNFVTSGLATVGAGFRNTYYSSAQGQSKKAMSTQHPLRYQQLYYPRNAVL